MDSSPKSSKKSNATTDSPSSNPVEIQSPIFTYISNLSPIKPVKVAPAPQGFPGLNSPPLVFTSPRINSSSDSALLKRPQLSVTGIDEKFKEAVTVAGESGMSNPQSSSGSTTCPQNAHVYHNSLPGRASSVLTSSDDFLTNNMNMDCSAFSSSGNIPQLVDMPVDSAVSEVIQDDKGKDEMVPGASPLIKDKDDKGKDEMAAGASPLMNEQTEEMHQVKPLPDLKPAEVAEKLGTGNASSEPYPAAESNSSIDCGFKNQCGQLSTAENARAGNGAELGFTSQLGSLQNAEEQGNCGEHTDVQCTEAGQETIQHDHILKVGPQQRGIRRRCLQFEDAQRKTIEKSISAINLSGTAGFPSSSSSSEVLEVLESSSLDKPAISGTGLLANVTRPTFSSQHSGNYTMKVPKPSGIGLHLNSIVNTPGATVSLRSAERGSLSILGKKSSSTTGCRSSKNSSISLNRAEVVSMSSEDCRHDNVASIAASSTSLSDRVKHMNEYLLFKPIELQPNLCDKRKSSFENADSIDDSCPSSPKKKRKKTLDIDDNNGCKRCNCKKTKCLKLYCDCFAAGIYCADPCACQGCFNRPEYEDTVLETRQQIESRNPQAFAPKIIQHINEPASSMCGDDGIHNTPASARHKRGCNCKKSKCSKKYCECYQSGVGCCDGCRCEGCENQMGRKGDHKKLVSKRDDDEIIDGSYDNEMGQMVTGDNLLHNDLCNSHTLTPSTPSLQCSNHGRTGSNSWFSSGRYLPSPESSVNFLAPYGSSPGLALNPDNHGVIPEANSETMDFVAFDPGLEYGSRDTMNQFPTGFDGSTLPDPRSSENMLRTQMLQGNFQIPPASSLRWRSSSISPVTHFGGTKLPEVANFDTGSYGMLNDDTPEVLKETPTPLHAVKVSSPNKKRVSPPHGHRSVIGSSSSAGLRSGRKFILQAVPSFPPLTPCNDSNVHAGQNIKDSKDCNRR